MDNDAQRLAEWHEGMKFDGVKLAVWIGLFLICVAVWFVAAFSFFG